jgi:hypothetical protein
MKCPLSHTIIFFVEKLSTVVKQMETGAVDGVSCALTYQHITYYVFLKYFCSGS